jgi:hypothetical protein
MMSDPGRGGEGGRSITFLVLRFHGPSVVMAVCFSGTVAFVSGSEEEGHLGGR